MQHLHISMAQKEEKICTTVVIETILYNTEVKIHTKLGKN